MRKVSRKQYNCQYCDISFMALPVHKRKFCSRQCHDLSTRKVYDSTECLACGIEIPYSPHRPQRKYCSKNCQHAHLKYNNCAGWKGGVCVRSRPNGNKEVFWVVGMGKTPNKGHPYGHLKYRTRARVLVEQEIGRLLKRTELVWHINGNTLDDSLSNLYLFPSRAEFNKAMYGFRYTIPTDSNLKVRKSCKVAE